MDIVYTCEHHPTNHTTRRHAFMYIAAHIQYTYNNIFNMATKWTKVYDNDSGHYYYLNSYDGSSTWEKPEDYSEPTAKWTKEWDNTSNSYYYLNCVTGESTWEKPIDFVDKRQYRLKQKYRLVSRRRKNSINPNH